MFVSRHSPIDPLSEMRIEQTIVRLNAFAAYQQESKTVTAESCRCDLGFLAMHTRRARSTEAMLEALEASGPYPDWAEKMSLFGRLVGSWDIEGTHFDGEGRVTKRQTGEWHFGWVLEGRVIQDVIISPPRAHRKPGERWQEYGTTLRAYDPKTDTWQVTYIAPVYGATVNLVAREHNDEIWLEGTSPDGTLMRWTFSEFSEDRVVWQGFESHDGGSTWKRDEVIVLARQTSQDVNRKREKQFLGRS